jgi:hypothetical protein
MSGSQDDVVAKNQKLDADLKGKLDFFIWHQRFKRAYKAWSDTPTDLKMPFLLTGEALSTAEGWMLMHPGKLSDGERRFIMRSVAQSTQKIVVAQADETESDNKRSSRIMIPLMAAAMVMALIALPRLLRDEPARVASAPPSTTQGETQSPPPAATPEPVRQAGTTPVEAVPSEPTEKPAGETTTASAEKPAVNDAGPVRLSRQPFGLMAKTHPTRLTELADDRRRTGDTRTGLLVAAEAIQKIAAMPPGVERDGLALPAVTSLMRGLSQTNAFAAPLAETAAAPTVLFCDGLQAAVTASQTGILSLARFGATQHPPAAIAASRTFLLGAAVDRSCQKLVVPGDDDAAELWSLETGRRLARFEGHDHDLVAAALSPDGRIVATTAQDKTARLWDAASGRQRAVLAGHDGYVLRAAFSPDGRLIATASTDKTVRIWNTATGKQSQVLSGHMDRVTEVAFSPDGARLLSTSADRTAHLVRIDGAEPVKIIRAPGRGIVEAKFTSDGRRILTVSDDGNGQVFDGQTGVPLFELADSPGSVRSLTASGDSRYLLAATWEGQAILHEGDTGRVIAVLTDRGQKAVAVAFGARDQGAIVLLADGRKLTTPVFDGIGSAVEGATAAAGSCLSAEEWEALGYSGQAAKSCGQPMETKGAWLSTAAPRTVERKPVEVEAFLDEVVAAAGERS